MTQNQLQLQRTKCEIYTRVMGYFRPVSHFNTGKKAEHYNRVHFKEETSRNSLFIHKYWWNGDSLSTKNDTGWFSR